MATKISFRWMKVTKIYFLGIKIIEIRRPNFCSIFSPVKAEDLRSIIEETVIETVRQYA